MRDAGDLLAALAPVAAAFRVGVGGLLERLLSQAAG
jgi:hypothetical protein